MEVTAPSDMVEESLVCICVGWSTYHEIGHSVCAKYVEAVKGNVGECKGVEILSIRVRSTHIGKPNPVVYPFCRELPWLHSYLYKNLFYVEGRGETDTEITDRLE